MPKLIPRLKRLYDYIRKSNTRFKKMSPAEKRVQIAKDVLLQLNLRRIKAASTYFDNDKVEEAIGGGRVFSEKKQEWVDAKPQDKELREVFKEMPKCDVCGIGSVFVAMVDRMDKLKLKDLGGSIEREDMVLYAARMKVFNRAQMALIEEAFENYNGFNNGIDNGNMRLRRVMKAIIDNKGKISRETFPYRVHDYSGSGW